MNKYTKHIIRRIRDLNENYSEIVFQRDGLQFSPGSCVKLYGIDYPSILIASGIQEPWIRLIVNRDLLSNFPAGTKYIKLYKDIDNKMPTLAAAAAANWIVSSECIGAFFSYVSTYPDRKCKVCYLGSDKIQENWIKANHKMVNIKSLKGDKNLYITGNSDLFKTKPLEKLLSICKESYII